MTLTLSCWAGLHWSHWTFFRLVSFMPLSLPYRGLSFIHFKALGELTGNNSNGNKEENKAQWYPTSLVCPFSSISLKNSK